MRVFAQEAPKNPPARFARRVENLKKRTQPKRVDGHDILMIPVAAAALDTRWRVPTVGDSHALRERGRRIQFP